jgi:hypothetical protein
VERLDIGDLADLVMVAPGEEPHDGAGNRPCGCSCCGWWRRRIRGSGARPSPRRRRSRGATTPSRAATVRVRDRGRTTSRPIRFTVT